MVVSMEERRQTTIRLPAKLVNKLKQEANKKGLGFNQIVNMILREHFTHQN